VALGDGALVSGEAQREPPRGANGVDPILAAIATIGDADPDCMTSLASSKQTTTVVNNGPRPRDCAK